MLSKTQRDEIKRRYEALPSSSWSVAPGQETGEYLLLNGNNLPIASSRSTIESLEHNPEQVLEFCAKATSDVPALLATIEILLGERASDST